MIELTRLNDTKFILNADLIESIEEVPDTVVTLTTGKKIFVKESRQKIENLVKSYKRDIQIHPSCNRRSPTLCHIWLRPLGHPSWQSPKPHQASNQERRQEYLSLRKR